MTVEEAKDKLIAWAVAQIGTHEGANNQNRYADVPGMQKLYGWNVQNQPWCDIFVDAGFIECFGYDIGSAMTYQFAGCNGAACSYSADYYKARGAWYHEPERGDQIFFLSGGTIGHTGIVERVNDDGTLTTIEGNTSDTVARRVYSIGAMNIAGYGRPKWDIAGRDIIVPVDPPAPEPPKPQKPPYSYNKHIYKVPLNLLKPGDYGALVRNLQVLLIGHGYGCPITGEYDADTVDAVMTFQMENGLTADGETGENTYKKLFYT